MDYTQTAELPPRSQPHRLVFRPGHIFYTHSVNAAEEGASFTIDSVTVGTESQANGPLPASTFKGQAHRLRVCLLGQEIAFVVRNDGDTTGRLTITISDMS